MPVPIRLTEEGASGLWIVGMRRAEIRPTALPPLGRDDAVIRTLYSGVSRGTERLVFEGRVPPSEYGRMSGPMQEGSFPFPVKYGYCAVGIVETGPSDWQGRTVFALHPHQDRFVTPTTLVTRVPDHIPAKRATLAANMETALNALWDGKVGPADRIVIVGAGCVGLLVANLAARMPGARVTLVDIDPERRAIAEAMGARFATPDDAPRNADVVFHTSATPEGLACAVAAAGEEATIVEMSWYGEGTVGAPLGGAFHSGRLKIVSSQVGLVAPSRRSRWCADRRRDAAMALLDDARLDLLVKDEIAFAELPARLPDILAPDARGLAPVIRYD